MEDTPLSLAHRYDRRADSHTVYKRFDEAVICHKNAAELLLQAMQLTSVTRALESLQLQYEYHKRQEDIIQVKIFQAEIHKKIVEYRKQKMSVPKKTPQKGSRDQDLQWAIFRTMEEADSLLGLLLPSSEAEPSTSPGGTSIGGQKRPKADREVIEELHTLNTQLRAFISQLLSQLEASERQVEALKARLAAYEESDMSHRGHDLPELAPLERPRIDDSPPSPSPFGPADN